jgi:hypothetical protein
LKILQDLKENLNGRVKLKNNWKINIIN